jgi:hypothetical protein
LFFSALLSSCAEKRLEQLNSRVNAYWEGLRWNSPGAISMMVEEQKRTEYLSKLTKQLNNKRIVDYNIISINPGKSAKQATSMVAYSFYELNQNDLKNAQELQEWQYSTSVNGWVLKGDSILRANNAPPTTSTTLKK